MRRWRLITATAAAILASGTVTFLALPASAETTAFTVVNSWSTGYQAEVTVRNSSPATITTWQVQLTFPVGTTVVNTWNATPSAAGSTYAFTPVVWNATIPAGGSTTFGIVVSGTGQPTICDIGSSCGGGGATTPSPSGSSAPPPTAPPVVVDSTPVGLNGQLHVCGVHLCNQNDKAIQLRGVSTHGLQWFASCYNTASLDALADDWQADLLRISMYVQEKGYETDPAGFTAKVNDLVDQAESRGLYAIVDFHTLTPGDPTYNLDRAKTFFAAVSARNAAKKNVIYEIANEPNGVSWQTIKSYAEQVIPVIRANDPDAVVIVGTRGWSSLGVSDGSSSTEITAAPVNATNIMYAFHFYAASHKDNYRAEVQRAAASLPLFVSEFGTVSASGDGAVDTASTTAWLDLLDQLKISYANWTYSDADEGSAAFKAGTCAGSTYTGTAVLTDSGTLIRSRIRTPDDF